MSREYEEKVRNEVLLDWNEQEKREKCPNRTAIRLKSNPVMEMENLPEREELNVKDSSFEL